jgi:hypothetical protein
MPIISQLTLVRKITLAAILATALSAGEVRADENICSNDGTFYVHWAQVSSLPVRARDGLVYSIAAGGNGLVYAVDQFSQIWESDDYANSWTNLGAAPVDGGTGILGCSGSYDGYNVLYLYDYDSVNGSLWAAQVYRRPLSWSLVTNLGAASLRSWQPIRTFQRT